MKMFNAVVLAVVLILVLLMGARRECFTDEEVKGFQPGWSQTGWVKKGIKTNSQELGAAKTYLDCAQMAKDNRYTVFTHRNENHSENRYKNTCVGFNITCIAKDWKKGKSGGYEIADHSSHGSGCTNGGVFPICVDTKHCPPSDKFMGLIPLKWF